MLPRSYDEQVCSIARSLEVVGERWTMLIVRDLLHGVSRFEHLQGNLGVARTVLATRLQRLCEEGVAERRLYQTSPERYEYRLTRKGTDLVPAIVSLLRWGDRYYPASEGLPRLLEHHECGGTIEQPLVCSRCGSTLTADEIVSKPGPGSSELGRRAGAVVVG